MATEENNNYVRINFIVAKCGKEVATSLLLKTIECNRPPGKPPDEPWGLNVCLQTNKTKILEDLNLKRKDDDKKRRILFPEKNKATDVACWDLQLVVWVLRKHCKLGENKLLEQDVQNIIEVRNKVCHPRDPKIRKDMFDYYMGRLHVAFTNILEFVGNAEKKAEVFAEVRLYEQMNLEHQMIFKVMEWNQIVLDEIAEIKKQIEHVQKDQAEIKAGQTELQRVQADMHTGQTEMQRVQADMHTGQTEMHRVQTNMNERQEKMLNYFERYFTMDGDSTIKPPVAKVELGVKNCDEPASSSTMTKQFTEAMEQNKNGHVSNNGIIAKMQTTLKWILGGNKKINDIKDECVAFYIQCDSLKVLISLFADILSGELTKKFKPLENELRKTCGYERVELNAIIQEDDFWQCMEDIVNQLEEIRSDTEAQRQPADTGITDNPLSRIQLPINLSKSSTGETVIGFTVKSRTAEEALELTESIRNGSKQHVLDELATFLRERFSVPNLELNLKLAEEPVCVSENIDTLLANAQHSLDDLDKVKAKRLTVTAAISVDKERNIFLTSSGANVTGQQLADWFLRCSQMLRSVGDFVMAANYYYKGIVFDPQWDVLSHIAQVWTLIASLFKVSGKGLKQKDKERIQEFLLELPKQAQLAEQSHNWILAIHIDKDTHGMYSFFHNVYGIGPFRLCDIPGRREALLRTTRCFLEMGQVKHVTDLCKKILEDDYNDPEAFLLWSKALHLSGANDIALNKCSEGLKYAKTSAEENALLKLQEEITFELSHHQTDSGRSSPDLKWLPGSSTSISGGQVIAASEEPENVRQKKKRRRPKANPINMVSRVASTFFEEETMRTESLKPDGISRLLSVSRTRHGSESSTFSDISFDYSSSDSDSKDSRGYDEETASDTGYGSSITGENYSCDTEPTDETSTSLFEKSKQFYERFEVGETKMPLNDTDLVKSGINLNQKYLNRFSDVNLRIQNRHPFYEGFLCESDLIKKLLDNPKVCIRCSIHIESSHKALCVPLEPPHVLKIIEISGRSKIGQAFNNDEVVVELLDQNQSQNKRYGRVLGVIKPYRRTQHPVFICTLDDMESHLVRPMCLSVPKLQILNEEVRRTFSKKMKRFKVEIYDYDAAKGELCNPKFVDVNPALHNRFVFLAAYINWSPRNIYPIGALIKRLPFGDTIPRGLAILNLQYEIPSLFRKETVQHVLETQGGADHGDLLRRRSDLTHLNTFSIGPSENKEIDKAFSIEHIEGGYKVGVHIADVSAYIHKDDPLDKEARLRSCTFYSGLRPAALMLPEPVLLNISLLPDKDRLTISVFFRVQTDGKRMQMEGSACTIEESFIHLKRGYSYVEFQGLLQEDDEDRISKDVLTMYKLANRIRCERLKHTTSGEDPDFDETIPVSCMPDVEIDETIRSFEEYLIMANNKVAQMLSHKLTKCIPIRCHLPPSKASLEEFCKKYDERIDVVVRLQDRQMIGVDRGVNNALSLEKNKNPSVIIPDDLWNRLETLPTESAIELVKNDDLFPMQQIVYQHWRSIQEYPRYVLSNKIKEQVSDTHLYTQFTSPSRRYIDIIVQRILLAYLHDKDCPYNEIEILEICVQMDVATRRSHEYISQCMSLRQGFVFHTSPQVIGCYADEISDKGLTLSSPMFKNLSSKTCELSFSLLDMGSKPEVYEDISTKGNSVKTTWRKRLYQYGTELGYIKHELSEHTYDQQEDDYDDDDKENRLKETVVKLKQYKGDIFVTIAGWARMLKCALDMRREDFKQSRSRIQGTIRGTDQDVDDVSTECQLLKDIQPSTKFSMTYSWGQVLPVQMSASPQKGILEPSPMLYKMTENVVFCLDHKRDPVLHLCEYAKACTRDKYDSVEQYLKVWEPLILMEAAVGAVHNEESFIIKNVPIDFSPNRDGTGQFKLPVWFCEQRNIELSGSKLDSDLTAFTDNAGESFDWLCLKTELPSSDEKNMQRQYWVEHATVKAVAHRVYKEDKDKRVKKDGQLYVSFKLNQAKIPREVENSKTLFSIEVLRKSEVDRRTESFMKELKTRSSLARQIALQETIPDLDRNHQKLVQSLKRDLYFETTNDDPRRTPLPQNNRRQQEAIDKALRNSFSLIQGPPGTGKTYTGIKLIYLFDKLNDLRSEEEKCAKKQVLFCGPSNKSVDLVAKWMLNRMGKYKPNFVRVYGRSIEAIDFPIPGRTFLSKRSTRSLHADPELKDVALHHLLRQDGKHHAKTINDFDNSFRKKQRKGIKIRPDEIRTYLRILRTASIDEIRKHDVILCTTAVGSNPKILEATEVLVQQVIVDESGMCPEPQCLIPIIATKAEQVVLIGDHKQLRPIILCREAAQLGLETSLFERYALSKTKFPFTRLEMQYRMHPQICDFPSREFYESSLTTGPGKWMHNSLRIWPENHNGVHPHVFVHIEGEEKVLTVSTEDGNEHSKSNSAEVDYVVELYRYMVTQAPNEHVFILSQYNAQCAEIKRKLGEIGCNQDDVSTVVSSQGGEWDYVIFSTVRSLPVYKIEKNPTIGWCKHNLGFITDKHQVNVALTRARKGLVIVGNKNLLTCDRVWRRLIEQYEVNGCVKTRDTFKLQRMSRQDILDRTQAASNRAFGQQSFKPGYQKF